MKKKWVGMLFALCLCLGLSTQAGAATLESYEIEGVMNYWWTDDNDTYTLSAKVQEDDTVIITTISPRTSVEMNGLVIPAEMDGKPVVAIRNGAVVNASYVKGALTLPDTLVTIGNYAFKGCSGLTGDLVIPDSVTYIGEAAFYGCSGMTGTVTLSKNLRTMGQGAFSSAGFSGTLTVPGSLEVISRISFSCMPNLDAVIIENGVREIGEQAFVDTVAGDLTVAGTVSAIHEKAFYNAQFTGTLTLGEGMTSVGELAFDRVPFTKLVFPDSLTTIGNRAFDGCENLSELDLNRVVSIGDSAFARCTGLSGQLTIGEHVESIGKYAFASCTSLTGDIVIPDSVVTMSEYVFDGCTGVTGGLVLGEKLKDVNQYAFYGIENMSGDLTIRYFRKELVKAIGKDSNLTGNLTILSGDIPGSAFSGYGIPRMGFTGTLTLGEGVTSIGASAFSGKNFSGSLTIPGSVKTVGASAFQGCDGLTGDLIISEGVTVIWGNAFRDCGFNGKLELPESLFAVSDYAFSGCSGFSSIDLGDGLTQIGKYAFSGCTGMTGSLILPDTLRSIGDHAFDGCSGLTGTLTTPEGLLGIGAYAFNGCSGFDGTLELSEGLVTIGEYAFTGCSGFTGHLTIPCSVEKIGTYAFQGCSGFTGLTIKGGILGIPAYTFADCSGITEITLNPQLLAIGDYAFRNCNLSGDLSLMPAVCSVGEGAFNSCGTIGNLYVSGNFMDAGMYSFTNSGVEKVYTSGKAYQYNDAELYKSGISPYEVDGLYWFRIKCVEPESLSIQGEKTVDVGETTFLRAVVSPGDANSLRITWSSSDTSVATVVSGTVTGISEGTVTITATTSNGLTATRTMTVGTGTHQVQVYAAPDGNPLNRTPLAGAKVTIYGVVKTTDANGLVEFKEEEIPNYYSPINISCNGYFEINDNVYFAEGFVNSFTMTGKGDKIYITQADMRNGREDWNLLNSRGTYCIPKMDGKSVNDTAYPVTIGVDWNIYEEGEIFFLGMDNGRKVLLNRGTNFISFAEHFDVNEQIKLVAQTKDDAGKIIRHEVDVPLGMYLDVEIVIPATESINTGGENGLYFLEKFDLELDLGEISECASKAKLEKGVLTLEFDAGDMDDKYFSLCNGALEGKSGMKVDLGGKLSIDLTGKTGFWQGGIVVGLSENANGENERILSEWMQHEVPDVEVSEDEIDGKTVEIISMRRNVPAGHINIVVGIELRAGVEAELTIGGVYDDVGVGGKMTGYGEFSVSAGPGINIDGADAFSNEDNTTFAVQLKGTLEAKLPVLYEFSIMDYTKQTVDFDPELTGYLSGVLVAQIAGFDLGGELKLGGVRWSKRGVEWYTLGDGWSEPQTMMMRRTGSAERTPMLVHSGIHTSANAAVAMVNGVPHLFFTAADDSGSLCLYDAAWNGLGWGEPEAIGTDTSADFAPSADGAFLVWEDCSGTPADDAAMDEVLRMSEITVGVLGENGYETTRLTNDTAYDHTAKVKSAEGKALVAWLSNALDSFNGNINSIYNNSAICYAVYDGSAWSEVSTVSDLGYVTNLNVTLDGESGAICYKDHTGEFFTIPVDLTAGGQAPASQQKGVGRYAVTSVSGEQLLAWFDSEQKLHIQQGGEETAVLETNFNGVENPVVTATGEAAYLFWLEHDGIFYTTNAGGSWSERMCLVQDEAMIYALACQSVDAENYVVSYLRTYLNDEDVQITDLMTLYATHGTDLWVLDVTAEEDIYTDHGTVDYTIRVYNHGEETATGATVSFYEGDTCVYTEEIDEVIPSGSFGELEGRFSPSDGSSIHDYTIVVEAEGDFRSANNGGVLRVGSVDGCIVDADFVTDAAGSEQLSVLVSSKGSAPLTGASIVVRSENAQGEVLAQTELDEMTTGQMQEVMLEVTPMAGNRYYVSLELEESDANPYNNWELLAVQEVVTLSDMPVCSSELSEDGILNIALNPLDMDMESGIVSVSVYDKAGKMTDITWETMRDTGFANGQMTAQVDLSGVSAGSTVKIIVLDGETLMPVCEVQTVEI